MIILSGKYNTAKIFTDNIDEDAISQIITLCNQPISKNSDIRIMPDVHAGTGCTIGTTMTISGKAIPNLVGVDIGCGMETILLKEKHIELQKLDKLIYEKIPSGFNIRDKAHRYSQKIDLTQLYCYEHINPIRAELSIGTLGGGNHFIEADKGSDGSIYIVIHSGSRHLGVETAKYYQEQAYKKLNKCSQKEIDALIKKLKSEGKEKQIQSELKKLVNTKRTDIPKHLAYTEHELFEQYIHDMKIVQEMYARGYEFMPIDIFQAKAKHFQIIDGKLMPALNTIDGMGDKAAEGVVEAAKDGPFTSCENFKTRSKVSGTIVDKMREMGMLGDLPLSDQMSLLDFM